MKFSTHPLSPDLANRRDLQATPLDMELVARLRGSVDFMLGHGEALADLFFADLFSRHPEFRRFFAGDIRTHKQKLMRSLNWIVTNLDRPADVRHAARELGKSHQSAGIDPQSYPAARDILVSAMGKVSGQEWSRELEAEWRLSLDLLSALMTGRSSIRRSEKTGTRA